jgi:cysteine dioxygenase
MSHMASTHPLHTTVCDFVEGLRSLETSPITKARVLEYFSEVNLRSNALAPYVYWNDSFYTRNLIYRDDLFEVLALCWLPGQKTPIHSHNGQLGWMLTLQGEVAIHEYRYLRCSSPENRNVVGLDCLAGGHNVELAQLESTTARNDGKVVTVDKTHTIHQIENLEGAKAGSVTLHIYSKPIDSCVAFDLRTHRCGRRELHYYSVAGALAAKASPEPVVLPTDKSRRIQVA